MLLITSIIVSEYLEEWQAMLVSPSYFLSMCVFIEGERAERNRAERKEQRETDDTHLLGYRSRSLTWVSYVSHRDPVT